MKQKHGIGIMLLLTVLAVSGMLFYDAATQTAAVTVETVQVSRQTVKETVICAGTVTATDGVEIYASVPCVAGEIAVTVGDKVNAGDVLLTVDRAATLAMAVGAGMSEEQSVMASASLPQTVTAPAAGVVSAICVSGGGMLSTDTPCVVLSQGDGVSVAIAVREQALPRIKVGQEVAVSGVAFDKKVYKGTITQIASSARSRVNGTVSETVVDAVVSFDEGEVDASLLIGLTAKAAVTVATRDNVLLVPYDCLVQDEQGGMSVYRVQQDAAHRVAVTVEEELPEGAVVTGLEDGDVLVSSPDELKGEYVTVKTEAGT